MTVSFADKVGVLISSSQAITAAIALNNVGTVTINGTVYTNPALGYTNFGNPYIISNGHFYLLSKTYDAFITSGLVGVSYVTPLIDGVVYRVTIKQSFDSVNNTQVVYTGNTVSHLTTTTLSANSILLSGHGLAADGSEFSVDNRALAFQTDLSSVQSSLASQVTQVYASPTFTGTVNLPASNNVLFGSTSLSTSLAALLPNTNTPLPSSTTLGGVNLSTSLASKAPLSGAAYTGGVTAPSLSASGAIVADNGGFKYPYTGLDASGRKGALITGNVYVTGNGYVGEAPDSSGITRPYVKYGRSYVGLNVDNVPRLEVLKTSSWVPYVRANADLRVNGDISVSGNIYQAGSGSSFATVSYVNDVRSQLLGGASGLFDTLREIQTALNSDANFGINTYQRIDEANTRLNGIQSGTLSLTKLSVAGDAASNTKFSAPSIVATTLASVQALSVVAGVSIGGDAIVVGKVTAASLSVTGATSVGGIVSLTKTSGVSLSVAAGTQMANVTLSGPLSVGGLATTSTLSSGNAVFGSDVSIGGALSVAGNVSLPLATYYNGTLISTALANAGTALSAGSSVSVNNLVAVGNITAGKLSSGAAVFGSTVSASGSVVLSKAAGTALSVAGGLQASNVVVGTTLSVAGASTFAGSLSVAGTVTLPGTTFYNGTLISTALANAGTALSAGSSVSVNNLVAVGNITAGKLSSGAAVFGSTVSASGSVVLSKAAGTALSIAGGLQVSNVVVGTTLSVAGATTFNSSISVAGAATFTTAVATNSLDTIAGVAFKTLLVLAYDGSSTADMSGNGYTLTFTNMLQRGTSMVTTSTTSNAATGTVSHTGSTYSYSIWVYIPTGTDFTNSIPIITYGVGGAGTTTSDYIYVDGSTKLNWVLSSTFQQQILSTPSFPLSQWVHVSATSVSGLRTLYMNGTSVGTSATVSTHVAGVFGIGKAFNTVQQRANVAYRNARMYNATLSVTDIAAIIKPLLHSDTVVSSDIRSDNAAVRAIDSDIVQPSVDATTKSLGTSSNPWTSAYLSIVGASEIDTPLNFQYKSNRVFEYDGSSTSDQTSNSNTLTLSRLMQSGSSFIASSTTSYARNTALAGDTTSSNYTYSMWVFIPSAASGVDCGFFQYNGFLGNNGSNSDLLYVSSTGFLNHTSFTNGIGSLSGQMTSSTAFTYNTWVHIAFTNAVNSRIVYVNGVSQVSSGTSGSHSGTRSVYFGYGSRITTYPGVAIRNMKMYNVTLSAAEVASLLSGTVNANVSRANIRSDNALIRAVDSDIIQASADATSKTLGTVSNIWSSAYVNTINTFEIDNPTYILYKSSRIFSYDGTSANDLTSNAFTLTFTNVRQSGSSLVFKNTTSSAQRATLTDTSSSSYTYSMWVFIPSAAFGSNCNFFQYSVPTGGNSGRCDILYVSSTGFLSHGGLTSGGLPINAISSPNAFTYDKWLHIGCTMATGSRILYTNGVSQISSAVNVSHDVGNRNLYFGAGTLYNTYPGVALRNMTMYSVTLSATEVANLANVLIPATNMRNDNILTRAIDVDILQASADALTKTVGTTDNLWSNVYSANVYSGILNCNTISSATLPKSIAFYTNSTTDKSTLALNSGKMYNSSSTLLTATSSSTYVEVPFVYDSTGSTSVVTATSSISIAFNAYVPSSTVLPTLFQIGEGRMQFNSFSPAPNSAYIFTSTSPDVDVFGLRTLSSRGTFDYGSATPSARGQYAKFVTAATSKWMTPAVAITTLSLSFWMSGTAVISDIINYGSLSIYSTSTTVLNVRCGATRTFTYTISSATAHYTFVYDTTLTNGHNLYINGAIQTPTVTLNTGSNYTIDVTSVFVLGDNGGGVNANTLYIGDLAFWFNRVLSATEILRFYRHRLTPPTVKFQGTLDSFGRVKLWNTTSRHDVFTKLPRDTWVHVVATCGSGVFALYYDGVAQTASTVTGSGLSILTSDGLTLLGSGSADAIVGTIMTDVRVFASTLTSTNAAALRADTSAIIEASSSIDNATISRVVVDKLVGRHSSMPTRGLALIYGGLNTDKSMENNTVHSQFSPFFIWPFITDTSDTSGNNRAAILSGSTSFGTVGSRSSLQIETGEATYTNNSAYAAILVSYFVYLPTISANTRLFTGGYTFGSANFWFNMGITSTGFMYINQVVSPVDATGVTGVTVPQNAWTHFILHRTSTTACTVYMNGSSVFTSTTLISNSPRSDVKLTGSSGVAFADVRKYTAPSTALSASIVADFYARGYPFYRNVNAGPSPNSAILFNSADAYMRIPIKVSGTAIAKTNSYRSASIAFNISTPSSVTTLAQLAKLFANETSSRCGRRLAIQLDASTGYVSATVDAPASGLTYKTLKNYSLSISQTSQYLFNIGMRMGDAIGVASIVPTGTGFAFGTLSGLPYVTMTNASSYMTISPNVALSSFSISFWLLTGSGTSFTYGVFRYGTKYVEYNGTTKALFGTGLGALSATGTGSNTFLLSTRYHITLVYTAAGGIGVYRNGVSLVNTTWTPGFLTSDNIQPLYDGAGTNSQQMSDLRLFNSIELAAADVLDLYNSYSINLAPILPITLHDFAPTLAIGASEFGISTLAGEPQGGAVSTFGELIISLPLLANGIDASGHGYNATVIGSMSYSSGNGAGAFSTAVNTASSIVSSNVLTLNNGSALVGNSSVSLLFSFYVYIPSGYINKDLIKVGTIGTTTRLFIGVHTSGTFYLSFGATGYVYNEAVTFDAYLHIAVCTSTNAVYVNGVVQTVASGSGSFTALDTNNISLMQEAVVGLGMRDFRMYAVPTTATLNAGLAVALQTYTGSPQYTTDSVAPIPFAASYPYQQNPSISLIPLATSTTRTYSLWYYHISDATTRELLVNGPVRLYTNTMKLTFEAGATRVYEYTIAAASTWFHITAVLDPTNGSVVYFNGALQTATVVSNTGAFYSTGGTTLRIGESTAGALGIRVLDAALWTSAALTAAEVLRFFNQRYISQATPQSTSGFTTSTATPIASGVTAPYIQPSATTSCLRAVQTFTATTFTVAFWFKYTTDATRRAVLSLGQFMVWTAASTLYVRSGASRLRSYTVPTSGTWAHVCIAVGNNQLDVFYDGVSRAGTDLSAYGSTFSIVATDVLNIGAEPGSGWTSGTSFQYADLQIFAKALTTYEVVNYVYQKYNASKITWPKPVSARDSPYVHITVVADSTDTTALKAYYDGVLQTPITTVGSFGLIGGAEGLLDIGSYDTASQTAAGIALKDLRLYWDSALTATEVATLSQTDMIAVTGGLSVAGSLAVVGVPTFSEGNNFTVTKVSTGTYQIFFLYANGESLVAPSVNYMAVCTPASSLISSVSARTQSSVTFLFVNTSATPTDTDFSFSLWSRRMGTFCYGYVQSGARVSE